MVDVKRVPLSVTSEIILGLAFTEGWPLEALLPRPKRPGSPDECVKALVRDYAERGARTGFLS